MKNNPYEFADDLTTLADIQLINDMNLADIDVTDLIDDAPLFRSLAAGESSNGTEHKYTKETGAPIVGFREPNTGRDHDKSTDELVTVSLKVLDATFHVDKALADAYKHGPEAWIARESRRHMRAAFFMAEKQFINGTGNEAGGFQGFVDALGSLGEMVIGAGGSGSDLMSVYMIRTNDNGNDCQAVTSGNLVIGDSFTQMVEDGTGKKFNAYVTPIEGWLGLQVGSKYSIARLCNLETTGSSNTLTDDLLADLQETFPENKQPNLIVMNKRARKQLQQSRTATNATGAPAPRPMDYEGVPIIATPAITKTETAVT